MALKLTRSVGTQAPGKKIGILERQCQIQMDSQDLLNVQVQAGWVVLCGKVARFDRGESLVLANRWQC